MDSAENRPDDFINLLSTEFPNLLEPIGGPIAVRWHKYAQVIGTIINMQQKPETCLVWQWQNFANNFDQASNLGTLPE